MSWQALAADRRMLYDTDESWVALRDAWRDAYRRVAAIVGPRLDARIALTAAAGDGGTWITDTEWFDAVNAAGVHDAINDIVNDGVIAVTQDLGIPLTDTTLSDAVEPFVAGTADSVDYIRDALDTFHTGNADEDWSRREWHGALRKAPSSPLTESRADRWSMSQASGALNSGINAGFGACAAYGATTFAAAPMECESIAAIRWVTQRDERVRPAHADTDTDTVPLGGTFTVAGYTARFPGDPQLPIGLRINCRCTLAWVDGTEVRRVTGALKSELYSKAQTLNIRGRSKMTKAELQSAILNDLCLNGLAGGPDCPDLFDQMNRTALMTHAKQEKIVGRWRMTKPELVERLQASMRGGDRIRVAQGFVPQAELDQAQRLATRKRAAMARTPPGQPEPVLPSTNTRRVSRETLFEEFDGATNGYAPCAWCGLKLNPNPAAGFAVLVPTPIRPFAVGGTAAAANMLPGCAACFQAHSAFSTSTGAIAASAPTPLLDHKVRSWKDLFHLQGQHDQKSHGNRDGRLGPRPPHSPVEKLWLDPPEAVQKAIDEYIENGNSASMAKVTWEVGEELYGPNHREEWGGDYRFIRDDLERVSDHLATQARWLSGINEEVEFAAEHFGMTPDQIRTDVTAGLKERLDQSPISMRITPEVLDSVLDDGRFKNLFETGKGFGWSDQEMRQWGEWEDFGLDPGIGDKTIAATDRPVYGYMDIDSTNRYSAEFPDGTASYYDDAGLGRLVDLGQYGDVRIEFSDAVRDRTTFTFGDSLAGFSPPAPVTAPTIEAMGNNYDGYGRARSEGRLGPSDDLFWNVGGRYVEAQMHGGLSISDIAKVYFPTAPDPAVEAKLDAQGISWETVVEVPPGVIAGYPDDPFPALAAAAGRRTGKVIYAAPDGATITLSGGGTGKAAVGYITRHGRDYPEAPLIAHLAHGRWEPLTSADEFHLQGQHDQQTHGNRDGRLGPLHLNDDPTRFGDLTGLDLTDREAVLRALGATWPPAESDAATLVSEMNATWTGSENIRFQVDGASEQHTSSGGGAMGVRITATDTDAGQMVASMRRSVYFDRSRVHAANLDVDGAYQGQGIGTHMRETFEDWAAAVGAERVTVSAVDVGAYAWARAGYDWTPWRGDDEFKDLGVKMVTKRMGDYAQQVRDHTAGFNPAPELRPRYDDLADRFDQAALQARPDGAIPDIAPTPWEVASTIGRIGMMDAFPTWGGEKPLRRVDGQEDLAIVESRDRRLERVRAAYDQWWPRFPAAADGVEDPEAEAEFERLLSQSATSDTFHLQGQHDQKSHGNRDGTIPDGADTVDETAADRAWADREGNDRLSGTGDCYSSAFNTMMDTMSAPDADQYRLVHGVVTGQGDLDGVRFDHSWVERTTTLDVPVNVPPGADPDELDALREAWANVEIVTVIDRSNGNDIELPASLYYKVGDVNPDELTRYTHTEMAANAVRYEHYGPWDEET